MKFKIRKKKSLAASNRRIKNYYFTYGPLVGFFGKKLSLQPSK